MGVLGVLVLHWYGAVQCITAMAATGLALWVAITLFLIVFLVAVVVLSQFQVWLVARYATDVK